MINASSKVKQLESIALTPQIVKNSTLKFKAQIVIPYTRL